MNFGQVLTAMVTPFSHDGEVDYDATRKLVNHLIRTGTDALVVTGTTGESPTLSLEEKVAIWRCVIDTVNGRIPVIAGTGTNSTKESIELTKIAEKEGVDGVMLVTPYYNKPSQQGMFEHFKAIAESTTLPIMLYNIPGRSVVNLEVDTIVELAKIDNIVSIKEASGNLNAMSEIIERTPDSFTLYSGDDALTLPVLSIGGTGIVSVASHIVGNDMKEMIQAFFNGEVKKAADIHRQLLPIFNSLFIAPNPTPVKEALAMLGMSVGSVRLPLVPLTKNEKIFLQKSIQYIVDQAS